MNNNQNADYASWQQYNGDYGQQNHGQVDDQGPYGRGSMDARSGSFEEARRYNDGPRDDFDRSGITNAFLQDDVQPFTNKVHNPDKPQNSKKLRKKNPGTKNGESKSSHSTRSHKHRTEDHHHYQTSGKKDQHK